MNKSDLEAALNEVLRLIEFDEMTADAVRLTQNITERRRRKILTNARRLVGWPGRGSDRDETLKR